jgi:hypothetical protein
LCRPSTLVEALIHLLLESHAQSPTSPRRPCILVYIKMVYIRRCRGRIYWAREAWPTRG